MDNDKIITLTNMPVKDIPQRSVIDWQVGTPSEGGRYLVLCVRGISGLLSINSDVWLDDRKQWQSNYHNLVAWCNLDDIYPLVNE